MAPQSLLTERLYEQVLLEPASAGADRLLVVSGYATPAMASRLLTDLGARVGHSVAIDLIVGMVGYEGITIQDHDGFLTLQASPPAGRITVSYTVDHRSVHTKLFVWMSGGTPVAAFAGSANFTQNGFLIGKRRTHHSELLTAVDPAAALAEFERVEGESLRADYPTVEEEVAIGVRRSNVIVSVAASDDVDASPDLAGMDYVVLPLVAQNSSAKGTVRGHPHLQWGLNWGQRGNRDRNQAVIPVPSRVWEQNPDFFPKGTAGDRPQFLVTTDDGKSIFFVVAEQGNKALHSVPSNSLVGEYFRSRLGVASRAPVALNDLIAGGSRFVRIYRTEDEGYFLEYSPEADAEGEELYDMGPIDGGTTHLETSMGVGQGSLTDGREARRVGPLESALRRQIDELMRRYGDGEIDQDAYLEGMAELTARQEV